MFYLSWIEKNDPFVPEKHKQSAFELCRIVLKEEEGSPAVLDIFFSHKQILPHQKTAVLFFQHNHQLKELFRGTRMHHYKSKDHLLSIQLSVCTSVDIDFLQKEATNILKDQLFAPPFYHPLFEKEGSENALSGLPYVFYWDRLTGAPRLSAACPETKPKDITNLYDAASLTYSLEKPITKIHLSLNAQWIQSVHGFFFIDKRLNSLFPDHRISTYTAKSFECSWPKLGLSVGNSGYKVGYSSLERTESHSFFLGKKSDDALYNQSILVAKKTWFEASLGFFWHLKQKRDETITVDITSAVQVQEGISQSLSYRLNKLVEKEDYFFWHPTRFYAKDQLIQYETHAYKALKGHVSGRRFDPDEWIESPQDTEKLRVSLNSSFFLTKKGHEAFDHALMRAKTAFIWGARCFKINLKGKPAHLAFLTTDDVVCLNDERLPGGSAIGKVIDYALSAEYGKEQVSLTIACSIGQSSYQPAVIQKKSVYAPDGYWPEIYGGHAHLIHTCQGMSYYRFDEQVPTDEYAYFGWKGSRPLIKNIRLVNGPKDQEKFLYQLYDTSSSEGKKNPHYLQKKGTRLYFEFQTLRGKERISHTIKPSMVGSFVPAQHIHLEK